MSLDLREGAGVERQEHEARELASTQGFQVVQVYCDNNRSATSGKKREAYEALLKDAADHKFDAIFCWSTDRLYRGLADLQRLVKAVEDTGIPVFAVTAGKHDLDLSNPDDLMVAQMLAAVAGREVAALKRRLLAHYRQERREGRAASSVVPFGWQRAEKPGRFIPDSETAPVVAELYDRFLAGENLSQLARWLNEQGYKGSRGGEWRQGRVSALLRNPRNGGYVRDKEGRLVKSADGGLVDRGVWQRANGILSDPKRRLSGAPVKTWLSGLMWCEKCGGRLAAGSNNRRGSKERYPTYACQRGCVNWPRERASERADALVRDVLVQIVPTLREQWQREAEQVAAEAANPEAIAQYEKLLVDMDDLAADLGAGNVSMEQFQIANAGMMARKKALETQMEPPEVVIEGVLGEHDFLAAWDTADDLGKRQVCDTLGVRFDVGSPRKNAFALSWREAEGDEDG